MTSVIDPFKVISEKSLAFVHTAPIAIFESSSFESHIFTALNRLVCYTFWCLKATLTLMLNGIIGDASL